MNGAIVVLEGADCAGKSTLAKAVLAQAVDNRLDAAYLHGLPWVGRVLAEHLRVFKEATALADRGGVAVVDHYTVAESLYGAEYRDGPAYDVSRIEEALELVGALRVFCVPTDLQAQIERHAKRRAKGKEDFASASGIVSRYADLVHGNMFRPGMDPASVDTRHGDVMNRATSRLYCMDTHHGQKRVETKAGHLLEEARRLRMTGTGPDVVSGDLAYHTLRVGYRHELRAADPMGGRLAEAAEVVDTARYLKNQGDR